jgi:hypothetical protein
MLFSMALGQQEILLRESEFCLAPVSGESGTDTCYGDGGGLVRLVGLLV